MLKLFTILLWSMCSVVAEGSAQSGRQEEVYAHASRLFHARAFLESEAAYTQLLDDCRDAAPYTQVQYLSGALELFTFTLQWKKALSLVHQGNALIQQHKPSSHSDSLQLATYFHRVGDFGYGHSYPSRSGRNRALSLRSFQKALAILPPEHPDQAALHRKIGMTYRLLSEQDSAFLYLRVALNIASEQDNKLQVLRCRQALGYWHFHQGYQAFREAKGDRLADPAVKLALVQTQSHYASAKRLLADTTLLGIQPEDSIAQYLFEGNVYRQFYQVHNRAKSLYQQADAVASRRPTFSYYERFIYNTLGMYYSDEGQYLKSVESYQKAKAVIQKFPVSPVALYMVYDGMGSSRGQMGDHHAALPYFQRAHSIITSQVAAQPSVIQNYAASLHNIAYCLLELGYEDRFLDSTRKALAYFDSIPDAAKPVNYIAQTFASHAFVLSGQGLHQAALDSFYQSNTLYETFGEYASVELAMNHANIAACQYELGREAVAEKSILKAETYLREAPDSDPVSFGMAGNLIGDYYGKSGRLEQALEMYHEVIWKMGSAEPSPDFSASPRSEDVMEREIGLNALKGKAWALKMIALQSGDTRMMAQAHEVYEDAIEMVHVFRQQQSAQASQTDQSGKGRPSFESALDVALRLYDAEGKREYLEKAFDFAEQSRAMVLLAAISTEQAAVASGVPDSLLLVQRDYQAQADRLRRMKNTTESAPAAARLNKQLVDVSAKQDSLRNLLKDHYQKYYSQVYETNTVPIPRIQEILRKENRALVEYFYGDSLLFTFAVTPDTFLVKRKRISEAFQANLDTVQTFLSTSQSSFGHKNYAQDCRSGCARTYARAALQVYNFLLGDLHLDFPEKLLIIPDGRLNFLSFDALTDEIPDRNRIHFNHLRFLLDRHIISYDYSFTIRERRGSYPESEKSNILAMAPTFDSAGLQELPIARANVENLEQNFAEVKSVFGKEATEAYFREEAQNYAILDLATHGKMDSLNSADCRLHFSKDSLNDGKLHLGEIYSMDLNARMAVLEACESGLGPNARGEGVMSLARGFSYAGCHTIVTSLWNVADEDITFEIISNFYQKLSEGIPVDEALTKAKREYLGIMRDSPGSRMKFHQPFYWAEMIVIGDTSPIPLNRHAALAPSWLHFGVALGSIFLLALLFFRLLRRRKNIA